MAEKALVGAEKNVSILSGVSFSRRRTLKASMLHEATG